MGFNPRPRAGGDMLHLWCQVGASRVSIRAPVRGATSEKRRTASGRRTRVSIRAPVRGATPTQVLNQIGLIAFQSAPPCGGRQCYEHEKECCDCEFQSAPPCGGRLNLCRGACMPTVSIRAPVRGATGDRPAPTGSTSFQSAPPCGGRLGSAPGPGRDRVIDVVSIRAPVRGATGAGTDRHRPARRRFNPRPRAGGDCGSVSHDRVKINQSVCANLMKRRWSEDRVARTWLRSRVVALLGYATGCANLSGEA